MNAPEAQQAFFKDLVAVLPDQHEAEFGIWMRPRSARTMSSWRACSVPSHVWKANEPIAIYRGVLISSGEDTLEEESSATGMLARFIELEGSPFERFDATTGALVDDVRSIIRSNHGHVYPRYVKRLMSLNDREREELREQFEKRTRYYETLAQGNGILARRSPVFAAAEIAGQLLAEILAFTDLDPVPSVTRIFARVRDEDNSDQAADARLQLLSWAQANDNFFIKRRDDEELPQTGKFRGEIFGVKGRVKDEHFIAIFQHKVSEILKKLGFRPRSILIQWRAQGVIQVSGDRKGKANKFTYPVSIDGKQVRLIKIVA